MLQQAGTMVRQGIHRVTRLREARELARAAAIRRQVRGLLAQDPAPVTFQRKVAIVDALRADYPVEAICAELCLSSQLYYADKTRDADQRWRRLLIGEATLECTRSSTVAARGA